MKPGKRIDAKRRQAINSQQEGQSVAADTWGELRYQYGQDSEGIFAGLAVTMPPQNIVRRKKMIPSYSVTYESVTPESAEVGDYDDAGFVCVDLPIVADQWEAQYAAEQDMDPVVAVCLDICRERGATEWSSSDPTEGDFLSTPDAQIDWDTGEAVTYSVHFSGLTPDQWEQLVKQSRERL